MSKETNDEGALAGEEAADQVFGDAFDAAENDIPPELNTDAEKAAAGEPPPPEPDKKTEPPAGEEPPAGDGAPPAEDLKQRKDESDEAYKHRYDSLVGVHKHDRESWESEKTTLLQKIEELSKPAAPAAPAKEEPLAKPDLKQSAYETFRNSLTAEQKEELDEYEKDFDIVSKMEGLKRDKAMEAFEKRLMEFQESILAKLTPVEQTLTKVADEREERLVKEHFGTIAANHPDFEKYRDDGSILGWIESKPAYLKKTMLEAYSKGSAEDVSDLITDFKKENNIEIVKVEPKPSAEVIDINSQREAKRVAMQAVTAKRGAVNASMSMASSFEEAFDEAIVKIGGK